MNLLDSSPLSTLYAQYGFYSLQMRSLAKTSTWVRSTSVCERQQFMQTPLLWNKRQWSHEQAQAFSGLCHRQGCLTLDTLAVVTSVTRSQCSFGPPVYPRRSQRSQDGTYLAVGLVEGNRASRGTRPQAAASIGAVHVLLKGMHELQQHHAGLKQGRAGTSPGCWGCIQGRGGPC